MSTKISSFRSTINLDLNAFERLVIWALMGSAIAAAIGIVFLVLFFSGVGGYFGTLNDIAVVIQYILMLPIMIFIHRLLPTSQSLMMRVVQTIGLAGALAVIVLQSMLVFNFLPFQRQIVLVIPAFLVVTAWFVFIEQAGRNEPLLPKGTLAAILAGLVFGYPLWALNFRRRMVFGNSTSNPKEEKKTHE